MANFRWQKLISVLLILVGVLLLCLFVPFEIWLAILGVGLIAVGLLLRIS